MKIKFSAQLETGKSAPDPRGSAPAGGESAGPEFSAELVARVAEDAVREALERCRTPSGESVTHATSQGLWLAMNRLVGHRSAESFCIFAAGRALDDFEAGRKGVV